MKYLTVLVISLIANILATVKADVEMYTIPNCSKYLKQFHRKTAQDNFKECVAKHLKIIYHSIDELSIQRGFDSKERYIWVLEKLLVDVHCKTEWDIWYIEPETYRVLEKMKSTKLC